MCTFWPVLAYAHRKSIGRVVNNCLVVHTSRQLENFFNRVGQLHVLHIEVTAVADIVDRNGFVVADFNSIGAEILKWAITLLLQSISVIGNVLRLPKLQIPGEGFRLNPAGWLGRHLWTRAGRRHKQRQ